MTGKTENSSGFSRPVNILDPDKVRSALTGRALSGHGSFTRTLRVTGFAQSAHVLELLGFLPVVAPLARFMAVLLTIIGVWLGTVVAYELKGWRTILLPVIYVLTTIVAIAFFLAALQGLSVTLDWLLEAFGLALQS
jgi:hypothetical protein